MGMLMYESRGDRSIIGWVFIDAGLPRRLSCEAVARIDQTPGCKLGPWRDDPVAEELITSGFALRQRVAAYLNPDAVAVRRQFRRLARTERLSAHAALERNS